MKRMPFICDDSENDSSSESDSVTPLSTIYVSSTQLVNDLYILQNNGSLPIKKNDKQMQLQDGLVREFRSMSEGTIVTYQLTNDGDVTAYPNLPDNILQNMSLLPECHLKDHVIDDEIEIKFQTLAISFAIDSVTLNERCERQRRQRDQAEDNFTKELTKLTFVIEKLHPLCIDAEKTELISNLLAQLDFIMKASKRVSTSAEILGSVQQELRLAESVNLMLSYLRNLRQQRDNAQRQLQCTKRMLQETTSTVDSRNQMNRQRLLSPGERLVTRRRASIATVPRQLDSPRAARYYPMTGGGSLDIASNNSTMEPLKKGTMLRRTATVIASCDFKNTETEWKSLDKSVTVTSPTNQWYSAEKVLKINDNIEKLIDHLVEKEIVHEICCLGTIICLTLSAIILGNTLIEIVDILRQEQFHK